MITRMAIQKRRRKVPHQQLRVNSRRLPNPPERRNETRSLVRLASCCRNSLLTPGKWGVLWTTTRSRMRCLKMIRIPEEERRPIVNARYWAESVRVFPRIVMMRYCSVTSCGVGTFLKTC